MKKAFCAFVLMLTLSLVASAQDRPAVDQNRSDQSPQNSKTTPGSTDSRNGRTDPTQRPTEFRRGSDVMTYGITDRSNSSVGKVEDVVIDPKSGRIAYVVVGDANSGSGSSFRAVPWSALQSGAKERTMTVDQSTYSNGPTFQSTKWPEFSDRNWSESTYRHYGQEPYWNDPGEKLTTDNERRMQDRTEADRTNATPFPPTWSRLSTFRGTPVNDERSQQLGHISDIAIDPASGRVLYGVVRHGDKMYAVPWSSFTVAPDGRTVTLNAKNEKFSEQDGFTNDRWPNMADPKWSDETNRRYSAQSAASDRLPPAGGR